MFRKHLIFCALWVSFILLIASCSGKSSTEQATATNDTNPADTVSNSALRQIEASPALQQLTRELQKDSTNAQIWFARGNMYLQANVPEKAAQDFARALLNDSTNAAYYLALADLYFDVENMKDAIAVLEKGLSLTPDEPEIMRELGKYYYYLTDYKRADELFQKTEKLDPRGPATAFWQAMSLRDQQKNDQALKLMEKAVELDPEYYDAVIMLAQMYAERKDNRALTNYNKVLAIDSPSAEALYGKAMFYQNTNQADKALTEYKKIVAVDRNFTDAYYNMGFIYYNQKNYAKARDHFNMAIAVKPTMGKAYFMRGQCAEKLNDLASARRDYIQALNFLPNEPEIETALNKIQDK